MPYKISIKKYTLLFVWISVALPQPWYPTYGLREVMIITSMYLVERYAYRGVQHEIVEYHDKLRKIKS